MFGRCKLLLCVICGDIFLPFFLSCCELAFLSISKLTSAYSPPIIGSAIIYAIAPNAHTRVGLLIAFYCTQFILAEGNLLFSIISRNIAGQTKKSTTLALSFIFWAGGNAAAPQVRSPSEQHLV